MCCICIMYKYRLVTEMTSVMLLQMPKMLWTPWGPHCTTIRARWAQRPSTAVRKMRFENDTTWHCPDFGSVRG